MRNRLDRIGTVIVFALAVGTLLGVAVSAGLRLASDDLLTSVAIARGTANATQVRSPYGIGAARLLSSDVSPTDLDAQTTRGVELGYRSDRLRELTAAPALIGLLVALLTGAPAPSPARARQDPTT